MRGKIGDDLLKQVEQAEQRGPAREIPVIVTIAAGTDLAALERKGLVVKRTFPSISAVAGTLTAAKIREIAEMYQVKSVEYDGIMHAL